MNLQFCKMTCLQRKIQRKCMQIYQLPGVKLSRLAQNLISTCNRRVKSVLAGRIEISSRQAGIMYK